jgi:beta-lactamase class A
MRRGGPNILRWVSIGMLLAAVSLFFYELVAFSRKRARMPENLTIAGVHVGGLNQSETLEKLLQIYSTPIDMMYGDQLILLNPASVGFRLDTEVMLAAAELERTGTDFWSGFWGFLWNRPGKETTIPLRADYSPVQLEFTLRDIAARYDEPSIPAEPIPGSPNFTPGKPGRILDISRAEELIADVLQIPYNRRLTLPIVADSAPRPTLETLEVLLKQNIDVADFNGLVVLYVVDLRTGEQLHFTYFRNQDIPTEPDIAFSAASTIKIGIATAFLRYYDYPVDTEADRWLAEMITESGNDPADWLMERLDRETGPLLVTETLKELGLESSFIDAWYHPPAIPLSGEYLQTPGNQRTDIFTHLNPLNRGDRDLLTQTTASEMGMLLGDIYDCANGGGTLLAVFPDQIAQEECITLIDLLAQNKIAVLIEAGLPLGTRLAHKHGWTSSPLDMVSDAGIVFSPGGDYVASIFLWNTPEMIWETTKNLVAGLSQAIYNYFNPPIE